jgi:predicted cupin superfamily sugar epimerase
MNYPTCSEIIKLLGLSAHPEGGAFRETYRAQAKVQDARNRSAATLIYFMLRAGEVSQWHRVNGSDETFLYHAGDPYLLKWIGSDGSLHDEPLGMDLADGHRPQRIVPADCWQAADLPADGKYGWSLVACVVSPGFDFADFEMLPTEDLESRYPKLAGRLGLGKRDDLPRL